MNCDRIARWYRFLEHLVFGRALERRRFEYLEQVAGLRRVLMLGDGDGRFTAEFVKRNRLAEVDSVELSSGMLALARKRVEHEVHGARVRFWLADARTVELPGPYDLIVTHFFLDCFTESELAGLVAGLAKHCSPGGRWLISEFGLPSAGLRRVAAGALIRAMYWFFRTATGLPVNRLPQYAPVLAANGFRVVGQCSKASGLLVSELWERAL